MTITLAIEGSGFTSQSRDEVRYFERALFLIDEHGMIQSVLQSDDEQYDAEKTQAQERGIYQAIAEGSYLLPGFIDLHVHAPQWAQDGTGLDEPLEVWLGKYTFPTESKFSDETYAHMVYGDLVSRMLSTGTTTASYYATVDRQGSLVLAQEANRLGQRALVGKVVMDDKEANPDYYRDASAQAAVRETERFINEVAELNEHSAQGIYPVITPRFIPSCSDEALRGLGELAARYQDYAYIQTHCSESDWEHGYAYERYGRSDTQMLREFGLFTERSILAHSVYPSEEDMRVFAETGAIAVHCPLSNAFFAGAVAPIRRFMDAGMHVALGSDISGGYNPDLYGAIRQAVTSSRMLETGVNRDAPAGERGVANSALTLNNAFYLATAGGGESLGLPIGRLEAGYAWDAQVVDAKYPSARLPIFGEAEPASDIFQKIVNLVVPENIRTVWVQGREVVNK
ncbi:amidohydrolase family protein [Bifidobacterium imperatoris]|uniref:Amidohydrolase family protein n=1 Tax=Bifidobacterium imperatoris TaxID=2020965 RepID=A0A2N5IU32_9BIFI|nr:amidohydrolase family protein [Bifidobacterium imperatoris]PLS25451.1 chlorohydrolase [Bifidobacterium imperatoris]QSY57031.1 amidohydrolase family protein [Bifidobacterium imperatoris]